MAIIILVPGFFVPDVYENMGALYVFGSLLAFMFAHASILSLRIRKPEMPRPFKLALNIRYRGRELPVSAIIGLTATTTIWGIIMVTQPYSRWVGLAWMAVGGVVYYFYRRQQRIQARKPRAQSFSEYQKHGKKE